MKTKLERRLVFSKIVLQLLFACVLISETRTYSDYSLRNINVLNLLMPYSNEVPMKYIVQAFNGCYKWTSSYPDTLKIETIPQNLKEEYSIAEFDGSKDKCDNAVLIEVGTKNDYDGIVWLKANDVETGEFLKCEAKVKRITRLEILTKFRTLDVGDHEQVELIGYDEENNSFTTLEGLKFVWSVSGLGRADFVTFKNSKFKSSSNRHKLENMGYQSDIVILKGIRTGKVTLNVRLLDSSYQEEISTSVDIFVIEHFEIEPQKDLFLLPCSMKQLSLFKVKTENYRLVRNLVNLPSNDFIWKTSDPNLIELNSDGLLKSFKNFGVGRYKVLDRSKEDNRIERNVSVTLPILINIYIKEIKEDEISNESFDSEQEEISTYENNWNLLKGRYYRIMVGLFDRDDNRISLGDDDSFSFDYDHSKFDVIDKNKDFMIVKPIVKLRNSKLFSAELNLNDNSCLDQQLKVSKQYSILSEIKIIEFSSGMAILPNVQQKMKLFAIGGSGHYEWKSSNSNVLKTEQNGTIISGESGSAVITVRDRNNLRNFSQMEIQVTEANNLSLLEWKIELISGGKREVLFSATDNQNNKFASCSSLNFNFDSQNKTGLDIESIDYSSNNIDEVILFNSEIEKSLKESNPSLLQQHNEMYDKLFSTKKYSDYLDEKETSSDYLHKAFKYYKNFGICSGFKFSSDQVGEYQLKHALMKKIAYLRVYDNYLFQYPNQYDMKLFGERPIILYNSSMKILLQHGPWTWKDSKAEKTNLQYKIQMNKKSQRNLIKILGVEVTDEGTVLEIKCVADGEVKNENIDFYLKGSNGADEDLLKPVQPKGLVQISCKIPSGLKLFNVNENDPSMSYLKREKKKLGLNMGGKYGFVAELTDENDYLFWSKNSGLFEWNINPNSLGQFLDRELNNSVNHLKLSESQKGSGKIFARLNKIKEDFKKDGSYSSSLDISADVRDQILIDSLDQLTVSSEHVLLFLHPDNKSKIKIGNGSGKFNIQYDKDYITAKYNSKTQEILIIPERLGQTILTVEDVSSEAKMNAEVIIDIVEIRKLKAELQHKIMEENQDTMVYLEVFDEQDRKIPYDQYKYMDLKVAVSDRKGENIDTKRIESPQNDGLFIATPLKADLYTMEIAGTDSTGFLKRSNKMDVNVFEKMRAFPENLHLMKGSISGFQIRGGPNRELRKKNNFELVFKQDKNLGEIIQRENGIFEYRAKKQGNEKIQVALINRKNGKKVGEVEVNILVDSPTDFEIVGLESRKLLTDSLQRVIAIPKNSNGKFSPGMYPIEYEWNNINKEIITLEQTAAEEACGQIPKDGAADEGNINDIIMKGWQSVGKNIRGLQRGFAEIEVVGKLKNTKIGKKSINVEVIDGIKAQRDKYIKVEGCDEGVLLLPLNSLYQIKLKGINQTSNVDFHFSILQKEGESLIATNNIGKIKTFNNEGYALMKISEKKNPNNELLLPIVVKNPSSLIVEDSSKVALVPVKSSMSLKARMVDSLGRVFAHPILNQDLSVISSDSNIIDAHYNINKGEIEVYAKRDGETTIMVSDPKNQNIGFDILSVKIGALITPSSPVNVHVGGNIRFKINNKILLDKSKWKSSNSEVVRIEDGKVKALKSGKSVLRFDESVNLSSVINVFEINKIEEDQGPKTITNIPTHTSYKKKYNITFKLFSNNSEINLLNIEKNHPEIENGLEWDCSTDSNSLIAEKFKFRKVDKTEYLGCSVSFAGWNKREDWNFGRKANVIFNIQNQSTGFKISKKVPLDIIHGFFIGEMNDSEKSGILLDNDNRKTEIMVKTKEKLQVKFSNPIFKKYSKVKYSLENALVHILIDLPEELSEERMRCTLQLESPMTGQISKINMTYDPSNTILKKIRNWGFGWSSSKRFISFSDLIVVLAALSVIYFVFVVVKGKKNENNMYNQVPPYMNDSRFRGNMSGSRNHFRNRNFTRGFNRIN